MIVHHSSKRRNISSKISGHWASVTYYLAKFGFQIQERGTMIKH